MAAATSLRSALTQDGLYYLSVSELQNCVTCLEPLLNDIVVSTKCGHVLCSACVSKLQPKTRDSPRKACPYCTKEWHGIKLYYTISLDKKVQRDDMLNELKASLANVQSRYDPTSLHREIEQLAASSTSFEEMQAEYEQEVGRLKKDLSAAASLAGELSAELRSRRDENEELHARNAALAALNHKWEAEALSNNRELAKASSKVEDVTFENSKLREQLQLERSKALQVESKLQDELRDSRQASSNHSAALKRRIAEIDQLKSEKAALEAQVESLKRSARVLLPLAEDAMRSEAAPTQSKRQRVELESRVTWPSPATQRSMSLPLYIDLQDEEENKAEVRAASKPLSRSSTLSSGVDKRQPFSLTTNGRPAMKLVQPSSSFPIPAGDRLPPVVARDRAAIKVSKTPLATMFRLEQSRNR